MGLLLNRKRRNNMPSRLDLRWKTIAAADTPKHPTAVADVIAHQLDGMTITGVFTPEEIERALPILNANKQEATDEFFGAMLGMPLYQVPEGSDRSEHIDDAVKCRAIYREAFGFDPQDRIGDIVRPMAGGLEPAAPSENGRDYNPGNVRWYEPGWGGLKAHVGNEFRGQHEDGAMSHLITTTRTHDHLSYFAMLQPPDSGGALSVYDLLWDTFKPDETTEWTYGRDDHEFDELNAMKISLAPGEMVLFGGGWRWHRVDEVSGKVPRITYGGFSAPSIDGKYLHFWC